MKDAKGHGSNPRGGSQADRRNAFTQKFGVTGGTMASRSPDAAGRTGPEKALAAHQDGTDAATRGLFSDSQIAALRTGYGSINKVDPMLPAFGRLTSLLDKASPEQLKQLAGANIKFVSSLAANRVRDTGSGVRMNPVSAYAEAGEKAGRARRQGDEATARFHSDWARRATALESGTNKDEAKSAFDTGYRKGSGRG